MWVVKFDTRIGTAFSDSERSNHNTISDRCCACSQQLNEMLGELFLPRDMPEPPKESFFRGLFGGGSRPFDREELCKYRSRPFSLSSDQVYLQFINHLKNT